MNDQEKDEIDRLPEKYRPIGAWAYLGLQILFAIPIVGFIFLIIFSFNSSNINRRSFARSYFCIFIIELILAVVLIVVFVLGGGLLSGILGGLFEGMQPVT